MAVDADKSYYRSARAIDENDDQYAPFLDTRKRIVWNILLDLDSILVSHLKKYRSELQLSPPPQLDIQTLPQVASSPPQVISSPQVIIQTNSQPVTPVVKKPIFDMNSSKTKTILLTIFVISLVITLGIYGFQWVNYGALFYYPFSVLHKLDL